MTRHGDRYGVGMRTWQMGVVVASIVVSAALQARGVMTLVEATRVEAPVPAVVTPPPPEPRERTTSAASILARNPFEHTTAAAAAGPPPDAGAPCDDVRALVVVGHEDQDIAFAALERGGERLLRRRGGTVGDRRVAFVERERVWLDGPGGLCQAPLFAPRVRPSARPPTTSPLAREVASMIRATGPGSFRITRAAVERILEAQSDLAHSRAVVEKQDGRAVGVRLQNVAKGSVLAQIGLATGDRIDTVNGFAIAEPEQALQAYGRLRLADRLTVQVQRAGRPMTLDYVIE